MQLERRALNTFPPNQNQRKVVNPRSKNFNVDEDLYARSEALQACENSAASQRAGCPGGGSMLWRTVFISAWFVIAGSIA